MKPRWDGLFRPLAWQTIPSLCKHVLRIVLNTNILALSMAVNVTVVIVLGLALPLLPMVVATWRAQEMPAWLVEDQMD